MREKGIQDLIRVAVSRAGAITFRNNTGQAWTGNKVDRLPGGKVLIHDARPINFGLAVGSSDLIGWTPVEITADMIGQTVAVFTAIEVKTLKGRPTDAQVNFIETVKLHGGKAGVARTEEEAVAILSRENTTLGKALIK